MLSRPVTHDENEGSASDKFFGPKRPRADRGATGGVGPDLDQAVAPFAIVIRDLRSKKRAWLTTALTESVLNGLAIRNAGSGACPVRKRSGKAVMKMTGTSWVPKISLTASSPELPSAS